MVASVTALEELNGARERDTGGDRSFLRPLLPSVCYAGYDYG